MDGSAASLIVIPVVTTLALAAWLILVAYAARHPQWKHGTSATAQPDRDPAAQADGQLISAVPRQVDRALADAHPDAIPEKHAQLAA